MWWKILAAIGGLVVLAAALFAPIAVPSIRVDLPPAVAPASAAPACPPINLTMKDGGTILLLNGYPTSLQRLLLDLSKVKTCAPGATTVMIQVDKSIRYGDFMSVVNELQAGGYPITFPLVRKDKPSS